MDNLTHGLLGYAVYAARDNRRWTKKERWGYATAAIVGGEIPDIEGFTTFMGQAVYLTWHRGFTHSLLFAPVMALLAVGIVWLFNRSIRLRTAYPLALCGVFLHIFTDWFNTWGTGLLEPLHSDRYSLGFLFIVDIVILSAFLLFFLLRRKYPGPRVFRTLWVFLFLYMASQAGQAWVLHHQLIGDYDRVTVSADAIPTRFRMVAHKGDEFHFYKGSVFTPLKKTGEAKNQHHPVVKEALKDKEARALVRFLPSYGTAIEETAEAYRVTIYDPRFRKVQPSLLSTVVEVSKKNVGKGEER
ncbi:metal-dependent hydrolase [Salinithrix halophila]|uniref:Metal-dependent hydrolase n=1 Tax=Salinithrix halophila TaxID=1485204 RepID=A0ABV8JDI0_9BACL